MATQTKLNEQILEEASEWFVTFREGPPVAQERNDFIAWVRKSPEHVRAYLEISAIWADVRAVDAQNPQLDIDALIARARGQENVVALQTAVAAVEETSAAGSRLRSAHRTPARYAWAAAVVLTIAFTSAAGWWQFVRGTYSTGVGEQRSLRLADGSVAELNSRSRLRVRFSAAERNVELLEGQVLFRVAKDAARPFIVTSGSATVRAVGTAFDVYRRAKGTTVTVLEGKVEIRHGLALDTPLQPPHANIDDSRAALLSAGEQVVVMASRLERASRPNLAAATAWMQRQIVFESAALDEVAEEFNRYNSQQIEIDPGIAERFHINGVFSSADPGSLLRFLREQPGLQVHETAELIRVQAAAADE